MRASSSPARRVFFIVFCSFPLVVAAMSGSPVPVLVHCDWLPSSATKSRCNVLAHMRKQIDASKNMLAVTAMANFRPVEFAVWHIICSLAESEAPAALQASGDNSVAASIASSSRCIKRSLIAPTK